MQVRKHGDRIATYTLSVAEGEARNKDDPLAQYDYEQMKDFITKPPEGSQFRYYNWISQQKCSQKLVYFMRKTELLLPHFLSSQFELAVINNYHTMLCNLAILILVL